MLLRTGPLCAFVLGLPWLAAAAEPPKANPLPWATEPAEVKVGGLTIRADLQRYSDKAATLYSMQFDVHNHTDQAVSLEVVSVELLSAQPAPRPGRPAGPPDRQASIQSRPLLSWWIDLEGVIKLIRKDGRLPAQVEVPANKQLRLFVGCCEDALSPNMEYWRRGSFKVGAMRRQVTGRIQKARYLGGQIQGELVKPTKSTNPDPAPNGEPKASE